jgi:hypothetical protein
MTDAAAIGGTENLVILSLRSGAVGAQRKMGMVGAGP